MMQIFFFTVLDAVVLNRCITSLQEALIDQVISMVKPHWDNFVKKKLGAAVPGATQHLHYDDIEADY